MKTPTSPGSPKKVVVAIKFILLAIPGLVLFLVFVGKFMVDFTEKGTTFVNQAQSGLIVIAAVLMMLYGTGLWGQWRYLLVFMSIPVSFLLYGIWYDLSNMEIFDFQTDLFIFFSVSVYLTYIAVRRSYKNRERSGQK